MQELVETVISDMEKGGKLPWESPWFFAGVRNWKTGRAYRGMNVLSLARSMDMAQLQHGQFLTYKQAQEVGGQVKAGSHGFPVFFFTKVSLKDKETGDVDDVPIMRTFTVFGVEQVKGIEPKPGQARELTPNAMGDTIIKGSEATIRENGAATFTPAYYQPSGDYISAPRRNLWKTDEAYYSTLFHELIHWTAPKERANRPHKYEGDGRAFEELVAELGGAFLSSHVGFKYSTQHSAYLAHWVSLLKDHKESLYLAASKAQKAVDFLLAKAGLIEQKDEAVA